MAKRIDAFMFYEFSLQRLYLINFNRISIGMISKEGNNHKGVLNLHVHVFLRTQIEAWVSLMHLGGDSGHLRSF